MKKAVYMIVSIVAMTWPVKSEALKEGQEFAELKTKDGKRYTKVVVREVVPEGLKIFHESGATTIPAEQLPQFKEDFGTDEEIKTIRDQQQQADENWHRGQMMVLDREKALPRESVKPKQSVEAERRSGGSIVGAPDVNETRKVTLAEMYARTVAMGRKESSSTNFWVGGTPMEEEILYNQTKQIFRHRVVAVDLTNKGETSDFVLEIFWLGHPLERKNRTCVNQMAARRVTVAPRTTVTFKAASNYHYMDNTVIYLKTESYGSDYWNGFYVQTWSGYGYAGWVTRISDGKGKVLAVQGARPPLISFINSFPPPVLKN